MNTVVLVLEGPLQSWGTQSRFGHRDTDREPSKSGVIGLVGAALGMPRTDREMIARLARLEMVVRVDREGAVLSDFHTAGGRLFRGQPYLVYGAKDTVLTRRHYLMDACFVVGLCGADEALLQTVAAALQAPKWPLFLGRKSCPATRPAYHSGPTGGSGRDVLSRVPWLGGRRPDEVHPERLRCVVEGVEGRPRADVPVDFTLYQRKHAVRNVCDEWIRLPRISTESSDVP